MVEQEKYSLFDSFDGFRTFFNPKGEQNVDVNTEFLIRFDSGGRFTFFRTGGAFVQTSDEIGYGFEGKIFFSPKRYAASSEDYKLKISNVLLESTTKGVEIEGDRMPRNLYLNGKDGLKDICEEYFPRLSIQGELDLITRFYLPGDVSKDRIIGLFRHEFENYPVVQQLSTAYKAFLSVYEDH